MNVMLTGGLGYIGSHTAVQLLEDGHNVVVVDNLSNSDREVKNKIEQITGKQIKFYEKDVKDLDALNAIFAENKIDAVIHFAGLKAVGESVEKPLEYYENNLFSTINLLKAMKSANVNNLVFSSSATVPRIFVYRICSETIFKYSSNFISNPPDYISNARTSVTAFA